MRGAARSLAKLPRHAPGMRIGLLGGSCDPPHEGHRLISLIALSRLQLDRVWWLVTPGNPLKSSAGLPLPCRIAAARRVAAHPRIDVTGIEAAIGTRYTYETLAYLTKRCPGVDFVWIMGADSLASFHRWRGWAEIMREIPVVVVSRPWISLRSRFSPAARRFARFRRSSVRAASLPGSTPPAWVFLRGPLNFQSSTVLRARQRGQSPIT